MTPEQISELEGIANEAQGRGGFNTVAVEASTLAALLHLARVAIPSGQVAEDESAVETLWSGVTPTADEWRKAGEALSRLAAKAQGYERLVLEVGEARSRLMQAEAERAAAVADNAEMVARALAVEADTSTSAQRQKVARHIIGGDGAHPGAAMREDSDPNVAVQRNGASDWTMRDEFAKAAMQAQLARPNAGVHTLDTINAGAYEVADAMVKARDAKP